MYMYGTLHCVIFGPKCMCKTLSLHLGLYFIGIGMLSAFFRVLNISVKVCLVFYCLHLFVSQLGSSCAL